MNSSLFIRDLSLMCVLGCFPGEQDYAQEVRVSLDITFSELPRACTTDKIEDALCYNTLCEKIRETTNKKKYATIEHLAWEISQSIKLIIPSQHQWSLSLKKVNPPIEGLKQGVEFKINNL